MNGSTTIEPIEEPTPSPSPRPITTTDRFYPSRIAQFHSEYQLKDHLKESHLSQNAVRIVDNPVQFSPKRSLSKVLSDQNLETSDRTVTPSRRYSSSDIDLQSVHLIDMQNRQLIDQQKKRRIYHFNHTLFSNIYKRTHRSSSTDSYLCQNAIQIREWPTRRRNQSVREPEMAEEPTTSDRVYSRALEKTTLIPSGEQNHNYRTAMSVPDGVLRRTSTNGTHRSRLSESGENASDSCAENGHSYPDQYKMTKINIDGNPRAKKLSFLSARRRASYYPAPNSNGLSDDQKRKRDVIWPLKRSYSFDTPFHRETIDALNKGT